MRARVHRAGLVLAAFGLVGVAAACSDDPQNVFAPAGPNAQKIANLNFVYILAGAVALIVFVVVAYVLWKFRERKDVEQGVPKQLHGNTRLEILWTIAPAVLLA